MLKKFAATTSTAALAIGMLAAGAGVAAAQDEETPPEETTGSLDTSSLGSSDFDLGKIASDLNLAAQALNGPVDVTSNEEGGPTVSFTNETEDTVRCVGFTMPYSTVDENEIDPGAIDLTDLLGALDLLNTIEEGGGVSALDVDAEGNPAASDVTAGGNQLALLSLSLVTPGEDQGGVAVEGGESIEWTATAPDEPAAATVLCAPQGAPELADLELKFGVDKQVVADQINDKIPGGSIAPVGTGSISGGSVELGATALGSLGGGDDEGEEPTDPEEPSDPAE